MYKPWAYSRRFTVVMIKWRKTTIKHARFKLEQIPVPGGTTSSKQMHDPRNMCRRQMPQKSRGDTPRAIPFNIHTPLWTRSIKFEPLRKKDQIADTNTPPEIKKCLPYPSEKMQRSKDADAHNPSETAFSNPLRNSRP